MEQIYLHYGNTKESSFLYKKIGFENIADIIYINDGSEKIFVPFFEYNFFKKYSKIKNILKLNSNFKITDIINDIENSKSRKIMIPSIFPVSMFCELKSLGFDINIKDFYFMYDLVKKNKKEINYMKATGIIANKCFLYIENIIKQSEIIGGCLFYKNESLTSDLLIKYINKFLIDHNCILGFPVVACGKFSYYPHSVINHKLKSGEPILIDLTIKNNKDGYYVDLTRTYCKGTPKNKVFIQLFECILTSKKYLESELSPGKLISSLNDQWENLMTENGIKYVVNDMYVNTKNDIICYHSLGHGIGRDIHQLPVINSKAHVLFEENMMVAIEPGGYIKNIGGIRIEDTYIINNVGSSKITYGNYNFLLD